MIFLAKSEEAAAELRSAMSATTGKSPATVSASGAVDSSS